MLLNGTPVTINAWSATQHQHHHTSGSNLGTLTNVGIGSTEHERQQPRVFHGDVAATTAEYLAGSGCRLGGRGRKRELQQRDVQRKRRRSRDLAFGNADAFHFV